MPGDSLRDVLFLLCVSGDLHVLGSAACGEREAWQASSAASICLTGQNQVTGPWDLQGYLGKQVCIFPAFSIKEGNDKGVDVGVE